MGHGFLRGTGDYGIDRGIPTWWWLTHASPLFPGKKNQHEMHPMRGHCSTVHGGIFSTRKYSTKLTSKSFHCVAHDWEVGLEHATISIICYWNRCIFDDFDLIFSLCEIGLLFYPRLHGSKLLFKQYFWLLRRVRVMNSHMTTSHWFGERRTHNSEFV